MGRKKFVEIAGKVYRKPDAEEEFRTILNSHFIGDVLEGDEHDFVYDVLLMHPSSSDKIGCGVKHFRIAEGIFGRYQRVEIVRVDGSLQDFSYKKCFNGNNIHKRNVVKAFRFHVYSQTKEFREKAYGKKKYVRCGITNLNVRKQDCHIDHAHPKEFEVLMFDFLKGRGLSLNDIEIISPNSGLHFIKDPEIKHAWEEYHRENAILRVTLDHANLGQPKAKVEWELLTHVRD